MTVTLLASTIQLSTVQPYLDRNPPDQLTFFSAHLSSLNSQPFFGSAALPSVFLSPFTLHTSPFTLFLAFPSRKDLYLVYRPAPRDKHHMLLHTPAVKVRAGPPRIRKLRRTGLLQERLLPVPPISRSLGLTLALCCLSFFGGCAFGTRNVLLKNSAPTATTPKAHHSHEICFNGLSDDRPDRSIGHVQNGYGMKTAEVVAINNVPDWVNKEIKTQLANAGYVVNENCSETGNQFLVGGKIVKVYTTAYMNYVGEVTIKASITLDSTQILNKTYTGYKKGEMNWAATAESFGELLETSLKSATLQLISDIDSLDKSPPTGKTQSAVETVAMAAPAQPTLNASINVDTLSCPQKSGDLVVIRGKRKISSTDRILDSMKRELTHLYYDRFELNPFMSGYICAYFKISPDGTTKQIKIIRNTLGDKPIEERLIQILSNAKFRKISGTTDAELLYHIAFSTDSARASKNARTIALGVLIFLSAVLSTIWSLQSHY